MQYVVESFNNSSLFHKALKEAFEAFCNKTVATITSAELMANFCNTLLTKARTLDVDILPCKNVLSSWFQCVGTLHMLCKLLFIYEKFNLNGSPMWSVSMKVLRVSAVAAFNVLCAE